MEKIAIIGQGYVGLPLSLIFSEAGLSVLALDVDQDKINQLKQGTSYIQHINPKRVLANIQKGTLQPSKDFSQLRDVDAVIICVPTPLDPHLQPDMSYVSKTAHTVGQNISKGCLVALESTSYPGTTEDLLRPILESQSGLKAGEDFYLAYSPEREDPANPKSEVKHIPKLIGGMTAKCQERACELYKIAIDTVVPVNSCKIAEAAKLTENIFRSGNIALVNELKVIFERMDIDIWKVIEAAKTKPFGYMPFYPGPGLGGHCIPIDPFYLSWKAKEVNISTRFIELAGEINQAMPEYVVNRLTEALNKVQRPIKNTRILIVGVAYKNNVDDMRESPALRIFDQIKERGGILSYYDPYIATIPKTREFGHWEGMQSIPWTAEALSGFDAAVIVTAHDNVDYSMLIEKKPVIIDTRNALQEYDESENIWKA